MSETPASPQNPKRTRLSRRDFLILLGVGLAGAVVVGVKLGAPPLRLRLAEWIETSGGPPTDIDAPPTAWFTILPDNTVQLYLPKVEMGQGVHTGLAQIAAEELEIAWEQLAVFHASSDRLADPVATSASTTIASLYIPLRETAATLRELLRAEASRQLNVQPAELDLTDGVFSVRADPAQQRTYGQLYQNAAAWELPEQPPALKPDNQFRYIGKDQPRVDLPAKVTGQAVYGFDVRRPGMLYGAVARPSTIEGKLLKAVPGEAASQPGVVKVVIDDNKDSRFAGVVAETRQQAYDALEKLALEWDPGKAWQQAEIDALVTVGQGQGVTIQKEGDPEETLKSGEILQAEYRTPMAYHAYLEPLAAVAEVGEENVEIWASTQSVVRLRGKVAAALDRKEDQIIVNPVYLGGGLGRKLDETAVVDAARLSAAVGKPVQVALSRPEDFRNGYLRPPTQHILRAKLDASGQVQAMLHQQASGEVAFPFLPAVMGTVLGADFGSWRGALITYAIPEKQTTAWLVQLPVYTGWWRGLGLLANIFALESFIDELAASVQIDPLDFRLRHLPDNENGQRMRTALLAAAEAAGWSTPAPDGRARGLACCWDYGTLVVEIAEVSLAGGQIRVEKVTCAVDPGLVVNPGQVRAQVEGAVTMGVSAALLEEVTVQDGAFTAGNFNRYPILRNADAPDIEVVLLSSSSKPSGIGEPPIGPAPASIANAVFALTGQRLRTLPLRLEK